MTEQRLQPYTLFDLELGRELPSLGPDGGRGLALIRLHDRPLGLIELELPATAEQLGAQIEQTLGEQIRSHLRDDLRTSEPTPECVQKRKRFLETAPAASVVVATRDRPASLAAALDSILALDYPRFEVVVVDSAPSTDATLEVIRERAPVRYVREEQSGLAVAHNRGLGEADGSIVAFTDDDVLVDPHWLTELARALGSSENVACATGLILPSELETPAQVWLERYARLNKGFERRVFDLEEHRLPGPLYPYTAGLVGSGASMAFDAGVLRALGGFDPATGAGTAARGGDDLLAFFRVLRAGYALVYEPAAIVRHAYRRDVHELSRQMFGYGAGLTAYLAGTVADRPSSFFDLLRRVPHGLVYGLGRGKRPRLHAPFERALLRSERLGMLYGPFGYVVSRLRARPG
jgi:GT2 family glycosyltransferase